MVGYSLESGSRPTPGWR